jgi:hypothetical protein
MVGECGRKVCNEFVLKFDFENAVGARFLENRKLCWKIFQSNKNIFFA